MTLPIILFSVWLIAANVIAMLPSKDHHWTSAYILIAIGLPLLAYLTWAMGPIAGAIGLLAAMSVLRWPVIFMSRWLRGKLART